MAWYPNDDLERLLQRCREGDTEAWSRLIDRFSGMVYSIPRRYGLGPDDCADVFQFTFSTLYQSLDRLESSLGLPKYLAVMAAREALKLKRIREDTISSDAASLEDLIRTEENSAEEEAFRAAQAEILRRSMEKLPPRCRDLLTLLYLEGDVPYTEIASELKIPVGSIGPTRSRCLDKLRRLLGRESFFE